MAVVYEHLRNDTNEVFYVGIGKKEKRAFSKHGRNPHWKNIVNKVGYTVNIVYKNIEHKEAKKIEILLIEKYGRKNLGLGNLVNMTDGGEGTLGLIKTNSEETKKKISEALKGKTPSEETRQKMSEAHKGEKHPMFGKTHSEETRQKIGEAHKGNTYMLGKTHSEETRQKMSEAGKGNTNKLGKTHSEETRQKQSEAHKGKIFSEETRQKIGEANKHRIISEETRQKLREANKGKTMSEESRIKMSEAAKGRTLSDTAKQKVSLFQRNKEGVKGYTFDKSRNKYRAHIKVGGKRILLGRFDTPEEASEAYQQARLIYFI